MRVVAWETIMTLNYSNFAPLGTDNTPEDVLIQPPQHLPVREEVFLLGGSVQNSTLSVAAESNDPEN